MIRGALNLTSVRSCLSDWHEQIWTLARLSRETSRHWRTIISVAAHVHHVTLMVLRAIDTLTWISTLTPGATGFGIQGETVVTPQTTSETQTA